ncbi:MAG: ATP-binding cassette domain-containing protein [Candidatus Sumerlaeia bacterium]|nr:ATP-binding cassette domain-containing protein [Candidatus Sumerlaeia bacterium]
MLEFRNVSKVYDGGKIAVDNISLLIPPGESFAILGTSGAGKTTLLQCLAKILSPTTGKILLDERDIQEIEHREYRRRLGVVFQALNLFPHLTVLENLTLSPRVVYGENPTTVAKRAKEILEELAISELANRYPAQISGGQAQRVAIGRALILNPEYLLLDEPTSSLDKVTTIAFSDLLHRLKTNTTFIFVTHDMEFARATAAKGVLMEHGKIKAHGTIPELERSWDGQLGAEEIIQPR